VIPHDKAILVPQAQLTDTTGISKTKEVTIEGVRYVAVPRTLSDTRLLASRGLRIPGPIRRDYTWPGGLTPFDHQIDTSDFLTQNKRAFVFNEIGTGKTLSALWAADYLQSYCGAGKVLIIATLSTLWRVWADDIYKRFPSKKFEVLHGSRSRRLERLGKEADFYILNHDGVKVLRDELMARTDIDIVIVDESAQFRNAQTGKFKALWKVAGPQTGRMLWLMTGSPMPQAPTDIWAQARLVNPTLVPKYFTRFRDQVMRQINQFKWVPKPGWEQTAYSMCKPSVRFIRDECIDLPPCVTEMREVEMTKEQTKAYKEMVDHYIIEMRDGQITAANEGVKLGKLMQIATGAVYDGAGNTHLLDIGPKRAALLEALEECGGKAIVFVPFRHSIRALEKILSSYRVGVVHGGVSAGKRAEIFSAFQNPDSQYPDIDIILAHPGTMAHGLTLTATSTIIWWGPVSSYEIYEQAIGRITRPGQTSKQTIVQLVCSDIERRVYSRLGQKGKMQGLLLEMLTTK